MRYGKSEVSSKEKASSNFSSEEYRQSIEIKWRAFRLVPPYGGLLVSTASRNKDMILLSAAVWAAAPALSDVNAMRDAVPKVSSNVTAQANGRPRDHGIRMSPSGCLESLWPSPSESFVAGTCIFLTTLQIMPLIWAWRVWWRLLFLSAIFYAVFYQILQCFLYPLIDWN